MKKVWLIGLLLIFPLFFGGCSLSNKRSAIEIDSYPVAKVFINGQEMGLTPYRNRNLVPGEIEIRLEANGKSWSRQVKLQNNISTVVDWEFGVDENKNGGYVLYLEKTGDKDKAGLLVNTLPSKSTISINNEIKGMSPIKINDIGQGDRHVALSYPSYKTIDIFAKSLKGYQLIVEATLVEEDNIDIKEETDGGDNLDLIAAPIQKTVKIRETETGWLRVRESNSSAAKEVDKVNPGATYLLIEETVDWYKIDLGNGKNGWISSSYAEKI